MASFESIQRRIDARFVLAQKNLHEIALNNQGGPEDMARFLDASRKVATAGCRKRQAASRHPDQAAGQARTRTPLPVVRA